MTETAADTRTFVPDGVDLRSYRKAACELRAASTREAAASHVGNMAEIAENCGKSLRGRPRSELEHLSPEAWEDIATWLALMAATLRGDVTSITPPDEHGAWLQVQEDLQEAWRNLGAATSRVEWAAAWYVGLRGALDQDIPAGFARRQVAETAASIMDAPW